MLKSLFRKGIVIGIIFLFIGISVIIPSDKIDVYASSFFMNDGNLSGYVNNTDGYPIKGAIVIVFFHDTFRLDFSDKVGYYHVTNIPICWCMKEVVCSKRDYISEKVSLGIVENSTYNFILDYEEETRGFFTFEARFPLLNLIFQRLKLK